MPPAHPAIAAFTSYPPLSRLTPTATRSGSTRRPTPDEPNDADATHRTPRTNRPFTTPSTRRTNPRRQHNPQRRPAQHVAPPSSDLFRFFDDADDPEDPETVRRLAQQRPGQRVRRAGRAAPRWPPPQGAGAKEEPLDAIADEAEEGDDAELSEVDDTVDDGFFSRYRKEAAPGQRLTLASLDVTDDAAPPAEEGARFAGQGPKGASSARRMDRQTAASAFDAVDKLFGSINSGAKDGQAGRQAVRRRPSGGQAGDEKGGKRSPLDRAKWLDDVRARASTKGDREEGEEEGAAVDVDAVEDLSDEEDGDDGADAIAEKAVDDDFEEAGIGGNEYAEEVTSRTSGFKEQRSLSSRERARKGGDPRIDDKSVTSARKSSFSDNSTFQNLMEIARRGPSDGGGSRKPLRPARQHRSFMHNTHSGNSAQGRNAEAKRDSGVQRGRDEERLSSSKPDVSRLLGLTKQIISNQPDTKRDDAEDDFEAIDEEMETSIELKGQAFRDRRGMDTRRRQRYTTVRRIGDQTYDIHSPPEEWRPMSEEEVAHVTSDSRPIGGGHAGSKGKGLVADCQGCRGTGLATCRACLGNGWIEPMSENEKNSSRRAILEEIWNRPNLVVDCHGEAQCVMCNGIGKQFCAKCKGSGSELRKGFSLSEKNEVFDIFPGVDTDPFSEDYEYEEDEEDEDEEDEDEEEDFQLYRGPEEAFDMKDGSVALEESGTDVVENDVEVVDEVIDVEDESAELLATLEAMHLADLEEEGMHYFERIRRRDAVHVEEEDDDIDDVEDDDDEDFEMVIEEDEGLEEDGLNEESLHADGLVEDDDVGDDDGDIIEDQMGLGDGEIALQDRDGTGDPDEFSPDARVD